MNFDIRRLDIYRKVPKDLTQPTLTGAVISVICCFCIVFLVCNELVRYLTVDVVSHVYVDNPAHSSSPDRIPVEITVEMPKMDCEYLGIDIQDDLGRHEVGFVDATKKTPLEGGGCLFTSKFQINKVPGNFHLSTHASHSQPKHADFQHVIKSVRFGDKIDDKLVGMGAGSFNPLKDVKSEDNEDYAGMESHDYIMKVVPTVYENGRERLLSYQYTFVHRSFIGRGSVPAIWFRYELSPLTVKYNPKSTPLYHFLTLLCAIIGGVWTVASIIDGMIFTATEFYKKLELGKLS